MPTAQSPRGRRRRCRGPAGGPRKPRRAIRLAERVTGLGQPAPPLRSVLLSCVATTTSRTSLNDEAIRDLRALIRRASSSQSDRNHSSERGQRSSTYSRTLAQNDNLMRRGPAPDRRLLAQHVGPLGASVTAILGMSPTPHGRHQREHPVPARSWHERSPRRCRCRGTASELTGHTIALLRA